MSEYHHADGTVTKTPRRGTRYAVGHRDDGEAVGHEVHPKDRTVVMLTPPDSPDADGPSVTRFTTREG